MMERKDLESLSKDQLVDIILDLQTEKPIGWDILRELIWERDGPYCQVCGLHIPEGAYHCGHIVDRVAGGADTLDNLMVMDRVCNMRKPVHHSKQEFTLWLVNDYWVGEWLPGLKNYFAGINERLLKKFGEPALDSIPDDIRILRIFRYEQMFELGLIRESPKGVDFESLPEWKIHR